MNMIVWLLTKSLKILGVFLDICGQTIHIEESPKLLNPIIKIGIANDINGETQPFIHLSQEQAGELGLVLMYFSKHGHLEAYTKDPQDLTNKDF